MLNTIGADLLMLMLFYRIEFIADIVTNAQNIKDLAKIPRDSTQQIRQDSINIPQNKQDNIYKDSTEKSQSSRIMKRAKNAETPNSITNQKRPNYRNLSVINVYKKQENDLTQFFFGIDVGISMANILYSLTEMKETSTSSKSYSLNSGFKVGVSNIDKYIGGRFYGEGSYIKIPKFHILNLGVNIDLLLNFYNAKTWGIGGFFGIGGGMYMVLFDDDSLKNSGKVPFSPIGWLGGGFRFVLENTHSFELSYRYSYIYASIYNYSESRPEIAGSATTQYKLKTDNITLSYILSF